MTEPDQVPATVVAAFGRRLLLETDDLNLHRAIVRNRRLRPLCGDRVLAMLQQGDAVIESILARRSELWRQDKNKIKRVVAANIDCLVLVAAPEPDTSAAQIDRYLALAELCGLNAIIVQNKCDLDSSAGWRENLREFEQLGYPVLPCSAKQATGLTQLQQALGTRHAVMAGLSGVGKSSLINALIPDIEARTSALSSASGEGRHTTTASRLYRLPSGGWIIDAPGVRDIRLWSMPAAELARGFCEFTPFLGHCKFNDCRHQKEPGCALREAVAQGLVSQRRFQSYSALAQRLESGG